MSAKKRLLLVDGYNIIGAGPKVKGERSIDEARDALIDKLHDYSGYMGIDVIVVFDAWHSGRIARSKETLGNVEVVFTRKGETADRYIERMCAEFEPKVHAGILELSVATSDLVEQTVVMGRGAARVSARELIKDMGEVSESAKRGETARKSGGKSAIIDRLPDDVREKLERMRRGEN